MFPNQRAAEMEFIINQLWPYVNYAYATALVIILIQFAYSVFAHNKIRIITPLAGLLIYAYPVVVSAVLNINLPSDHGIVDELIKPFYIIIVIIASYGLYRGCDIDVFTETTTTNDQSPEQELGDLKSLQDAVNSKNNHEQSPGETGFNNASTDSNKQQINEPGTGVRKISLD